MKMGLGLYTASVVGATPPFVFDSDAQARISAIESADGQLLEFAIKIAINSFIVGCKADPSPNSGVSNWDAIKRAYLLFSPRTLAGALTPIKGAAPTNFGFVSGDHSRLLGLPGNGVNKYLDTGRANNASPQNNYHNSFFQTNAPTVGRIINSGADLQAAGSNTIAVGSPGYNLRSRAAGGGAILNQGANVANKFVGKSRTDASNFTFRSNGSSILVAQTSTTPTASNMLVYQGAGVYTDARLGFYSDGEAVDLALLDARISTFAATLATVLS